MIRETNENKHGQVFVRHAPVISIRWVHVDFDEPELEI